MRARGGALLALVVLVVAVAAGCGDGTAATGGSGGGHVVTLVTYDGYALPAAAAARACV